MQIRTILIAGFSLALSLILAGCSSAPSHEKEDTTVHLEANNYKVIKLGAHGESRGFNFLGIIPIASAKVSEAKEELYKSIGSNLSGRSIALVNKAPDYSTTYLILFSIPKFTLTADVIEFTGGACKDKDIKNTDKPAW